MMNSFKSYQRYSDASKGYNAIFYTVSFEYFIVEIVKELLIHPTLPVILYISVGIRLFNMHTKFEHN